MNIWKNNRVEHRSTAKDEPKEGRGGDDTTRSTILDFQSSNLGITINYEQARIQREEGTKGF